MVINGDKAPVEISLRVFLCYLFAYLTVISFAGFFVCVSASLLAPSFTIFASDLSNVRFLENTADFGDLLFVGVLAFMTASVVFCTIQGLYFLAERVHQTLL